MRQADTASAKANKFRRALPGVIGLGIFALALYALHKSLHAVHLRDVVLHLHTIPISGIALSIGCMICSYRYTTFLCHVGEFNCKLQVLNFTTSLCTQRARIDQIKRGIRLYTSDSDLWPNQPVPALPKSARGSEYGVLKVCAFLEAKYFLKIQLSN